MLCAAIDIHKHAFQAAVLDPESGEVVEERFSADRESLARWPRSGGAGSRRSRSRRRPAGAGSGASSSAHGFEVRLAEPVQARALLGRGAARRPIGSTRAGWPGCWRRRCCRSRGSRPRRSSSCATGRGCARRCRRSPPLGAAPARVPAARGLALLEVASADAGRAALGRGAQAPRARARAVDSLLAVIAALETQMDTIDAELRRFARTDGRCRRLQTIYGIGPILASHLLAEIGEASRFRRAEQITRLAGLDPVVDESAETRRRGHLAKAGSPHLRWALVEAAVHANRQTAPDVHALPRGPRSRATPPSRPAHRRAQDRQARLPRPPRARLAAA